MVFVFDLNPYWCVVYNFLKSSNFISYVFLFWISQLTVTAFVLFTIGNTASMQTSSSNWSPFPVTNFCIISMLYCYMSMSYETNNESYLKFSKQPKEGMPVNINVPDWYSWLATENWHSHCLKKLPFWLYLIEGETKKKKITSITNPFLTSIFNKYYRHKHNFILTRDRS